MWKKSAQQDQDSKQRKKNVERDLHNWSQLDKLGTSFAPPSLSLSLFEMPLSRSRYPESCPSIMFFFC